MNDELKQELKKCRALFSLTLCLLLANCTASFSLPQAANNSKPNPPQPDLRQQLHWVPPERTVSLPKDRLSYPLAAKRIAKIAHFNPQQLNPDRL
ncbi:hypothetical protein [Phormidium sp. CCY1219]|uniref:hypothetical protein n=1 Tax=Phormidium sp. CCY1219 TaxID=2886104 RepID=UPI002D1F4B28|nr:hypothetical protein [Phormidium sp. CCY1219]MEB3827417.1 hypothetical protein [Phormidium sp. CCY1219]